MTSPFAACFIERIFRRFYVSLSCVIFAILSQPLLATTVVPPDFSMLVNESDYIVHTVVKSVTSEWREKQGHRAIFTLIEMQVVEVINGNPPRPLVLEMLGGRVGDEEMAVQGMPKFFIGQEDVLFVRGNGHQFYPLTAAMHGRYPVIRKNGERAHITRTNRAPLTKTAEVELPLNESEVADTKQEMRASTVGLSPEDFTRQIRAAVNPNYRHSDRAK